MLSDGMLGSSSPSSLQRHGPLYPSCHMQNRTQHPGHQISSLHESTFPQVHEHSTQTPLAPKHSNSYLPAHSLEPFPQPSAEDFDFRIPETRDKCFRSVLKDGAIVRAVELHELRHIHILEQRAFIGEDGGASIEQLRYRQEEAPELFLAYYSHDHEALAYISATAYHESHITADCSKIHIPTGESVCVHSIVVDRVCRHQGIGLRLLRCFIERVRKLRPDAVRILLVANSQLLPFFTRAGFTLAGPSCVKRGSRSLYECELLL